MSVAPRPAPLDNDQRQLLTRLVAGRWTADTHQRHLETLGARGLLTTTPVEPGIRRWVLSRHGLEVTAALTLSGQHTPRRAA